MTMVDFWADEAKDIQMRIASDDWQRAKNRIRSTFLANGTRGAVKINVGAAPARVGCGPCRRRSAFYWCELCVMGTNSLGSFTPLCKNAPKLQNVERFPYSKCTPVMYPLKHEISHFGPVIKSDVGSLSSYIGSMRVELILCGLKGPPVLL